MQKVFTINPLDGEDRADLNKLLQNGWISMFYMPIKDGDHIFIYYHLQKIEGKPQSKGSDVYDDDDFDEDLNDIEDSDTDLEDRWSDN